MRLLQANGTGADWPAPEASGNGNSEIISFIIMNRHDSDMLFTYFYMRVAISMCVMISIIVQRTPI